MNLRKHLLPLLAWSTAALIGPIATAAPPAPSPKRTREVIAKYHAALERVQRQQQLLKERASSLVKDEERLAALPYFNQIRPNEDAGPFLNPRIAWSGPDHSMFQTGFLHLPHELAGALMGNHKWLDAPESFDLSGVSFDWMAHLDRYGYWSILDGGPLQGKASLVFGKSPTPNLEALWAWARARLLAGLQSHHLKEASHEVRRLAWLIYTTEAEMSVAWTFAILNDDTMAIQAAHARGFAKELDFVYPDAMYQRFLRTLHDQTSYGWIATPEPLYEKVFPTDRAFPGECAVLTEDAAGTSIPRLILTKSYASHFARLDRLLASPPKGCRLDLARLYVKGALAQKTPRTRSITPLERKAIAILAAATTLMELAPAH